MYLPVVERGKEGGNESHITAKGSLDSALKKVSLQFQTCI